eukprot:4212585-Alexandrium_andersonii.AAC.1
MLRVPPTGSLRTCSRSVIPPRVDHTLSHVAGACGPKCGSERRGWGWSGGLGLGGHGLVGWGTGT